MDEYSLNKKLALWFDIGKGHRNLLFPLINFLIIFKLDSHRPKHSFAPLGANE